MLFILKFTIYLKLQSEILLTFIFQKYVFREINLIIAYKLLTLFITKAAVFNRRTVDVYTVLDRVTNTLTAESKLSLPRLVEYISRQEPKEEDLARTYVINKLSM